MPTRSQVQTFRGNYLSSLTIRAEQVGFDDHDMWKRLIPKAARHWVDWPALLKVEERLGAAKGYCQSSPTQP